MPALPTENCSGDIVVPCIAVLVLLIGACARIGQLPRQRLQFAGLAMAIDVLAAVDGSRGNLEVPVSEISRPNR